MTEDADANARDGGGTGDASPSKAALGGAPTSLSLDAVLYVLANRSRRFVLYALADAADGVTDLATLVEDVATLEAAVDEAALRRDRYVELATDLHHWHLPALADVGVVDCDRRHDTIRYQGHPKLETWLARVRRDELGG